jgi:hypothetical protein
MNEYPLLWAFRIRHSFDCLHNAPQLDVPQSLGTTGSGPVGGRFSNLRLSNQP